MKGKFLKPFTLSGGGGRRTGQWVKFITTLGLKIILLNLISDIQARFQQGQQFQYIDIHIINSTSLGSNRNKLLKVKVRSKSD